MNAIETRSTAFEIWPPWHATRDHRVWHSNTSHTIHNQPMAWNDNLFPDSDYRSRNNINCSDWRVFKTIYITISPKSDFIHWWFLAPILEAMLPVAGGFIFISLLASIVNAASPSITPLNSSQVSSFKPFTHFASTAYCNPTTTVDWSCNGISFLLVLKLDGHIKHLYCVNNSGLQSELGLHSSNVGRRWWICTILQVFHNLNLPVAIDDDLPFFDMKGMLASRHPKQLSLSLMKEPILLKCWFYSCTVSIKNWICV